MPSGKESICCLEVDIVAAKTRQAGYSCITLADGFQQVCLNTDVILCAIYQYIEDDLIYLTTDKKFGAAFCKVCA
eukprot:gene6687-7442_t